MRKDYRFIFGLRNSDRDVLIKKKYKFNNPNMIQNGTKEEKKKKKKSSGDTHERRLLKIIVKPGGRECREDT